MSARSFIDSSILVYTDDAANPARRDQALDLISRLRRNRLGVLSTQVLQEYFSVSTRKMGVGPEHARRKVELFARFELVAPTLPMLIDAIDLHRAHGIAFWDALIVQSAIASQCSVLYSEDMQDSRRVAGVEIRNPFRTS